MIDTNTKIHSEPFTIMKIEIPNCKFIGMLNN